MRRGPGVVGRGRQPEVPELHPQVAQELGRLRQRLDRVERIEQVPRSAAVRGMNCASAPGLRRPLRVTGPTASARNRLSCQITRAKNSTGRSLVRAAASTSMQIDFCASSTATGFGASGAAGGVATEPVQAPAAEGWRRARGSLAPAGVAAAGGAAVSAGASSATAGNARSSRPHVSATARSIASAQACLREGSQASASQARR